jgi:hypothetical protein
VTLVLSVSILMLKLKYGLGGGKKELEG